MASDNFPKYKCTYCTDEVVGIRVKCAECTDFDLCLQCFSAGAEMGSHKNDHAYQIVDSGAPNVYRGKTKWHAKELLSLLTGIEKYGFGNWEEISSKHIKTRTADESRDEYDARFVEGNVGKVTWPEANEKRLQLAELTKEDLSVQQLHAIPPLDVNLEDALRLGYMPHRDDFDKEYENDAETLISSLNVNNEEDDELDIALKLCQVDIYIEKLRQRTRRKKMCRDYQLISKFFSYYRKIHPIGPEYGEKVKWLCQLQTAMEHECLVKNLIRQRELQHRLSELLKYRRNGLTRIEELPHFEQEIQTTKASGSSSLLYPTTTGKRKREKGEGNCFNKKNSTSLIGSLILSPEPGQQPQQRLQFLVGCHPLLSEPSKHLLTKTEAELCTSLDLTPSQYISIKTWLLANPKRKADTSPEKQIQTYIVANGWFLQQQAS